MQPQTTLVRGVGGETFANVVTLDSLGLGTGHARDINMLSVEHKNKYSVGGVPFIGIFGADFLRNYDLNLDLPQKQISLFAVEGCNSQIPPWTGSYTTAPYTTPFDDSSKVQVVLKVNNHDINTIFDTGAGQSLLSEDSVKDSDVTESELKKDKISQSSGISEDKFDTYLHKFKTFSFGGLEFKNIPLRVADVDSNLLGADFMRHYRIWIPKYGKNMFIQKEGNTGYITVEQK
ncbi:hypothetical protein AA106555_1747 [Neokomagataea thailandica NBRC 106555]|nr:hypothetical protein AA106555_1747 [Neokomagataea thailandica NBRC 106555]